MKDLLSQKPVYGTGKKIEELKSAVPVKSPPEFLTPPEEYFKERPYSPPTEERPLLVEEEAPQDFASDPLATLPVALQDALYRAEMWRQLAETPGSSDLVTSYYEAALEDLRRFKGEKEIGSETKPDNRNASEGNTETGLSEDRLSGENNRRRGEVRLEEKPL